MITIRKTPTERVHYTDLRRNDFLWNNSAFLRVLGPARYKTRSIHPVIPVQTCSAWTISNFPLKTDQVMILQRPWVAKAFRASRVRKKIATLEAELAALDQDSSRAQEINQRIQRMNYMSAEIEHETTNNSGEHKE